jgi:eukaryotic-like serine/threonine-protein kinase
VRLGADGEELCQLKLVEARGRFWKGGYGEAERAARAALETKDERTKLLALTALVDALGPQAKYDEIASLYRAVSRPAEDDLISLWIDFISSAASFLAAGIDHTFGEECVALFEQWQSHLSPYLLARHEFAKGYLAREKGLLFQSIASYKSAARRLTENGLHLDACIALGNAGNGLLEAGQFEEAADALEKVLASGRKSDLAHVVGGALALLTLVRVGLGQLAHARVSGEEALLMTRALNDRRFQGAAEAGLSMTEFDSRNFDLAESYARAAVLTCDAIPNARPYAVALLARALAAQGRTTEALSHAREAHASLEKMGGVDDGEATIRLALAECLLAAGDRDAARDAAASAAAWLRARADKIDHPPYRESFLTRIPEHRRILELASELGA